MISGICYFLMVPLPGPLAQLVSGVWRRIEPEGAGKRKKNVIFN